MSEYRYLDQKIGFVLYEIDKGIRLACIVAFVLMMILAIIRISLLALGLWPS